METGYRNCKYRPFREYYQIRTERESSRANGGKELGGHTEPSHSLFGAVGQIATETGWNVDYILDIPYVQLSMMMADLPQFKKKGATSPQQIEEMLKRNQQQTQQEKQPQKGMDPLSFFNNLSKNNNGNCKT